MYRYVESRKLFISHKVRSLVECRVAVPFVSEWSQQDGSLGGIHTLMITLSRPHSLGFGGKRKCLRPLDPLDPNQRIYCSITTTEG